ncbi:hypothetical protein Syun_017621 [Stephania yunnanensis]|uniref:Uncharacterized protein n=1 Tax=Stephania yunnanensis TaxID=152371 RepID=A0AAP0J7F1_9MAGN
MVAASLVRTMAGGAGARARRCVVEAGARALSCAQRAAGLGRAMSGGSPDARGAAAGCRAAQMGRCSRGRLGSPDDARRRRQCGSRGDDVREGGGGGSPDNAGVRMKMGLEGGGGEKMFVADLPT